MILDNYKTLLSFNKGGSFKDVAGNTVSVKEILGGQGGSASSSDVDVNTANVKNNHEWRASISSFNYDATNTTNSFTDEQTAYKWLTVINGSAGSGSTKSVSMTYNGFVLFVGTGTTEPTAEDFKLATPLTLDVASASCIHNANGKTYVARTFTNNTGSDVTVKELGCYVFKSVASCTSSNCPSTPVVMIGRTVLDTPVTIANGDSQTFTYVINNVIEGA